jgi:hypothetical protein
MVHSSSRTSEIYYFRKSASLGGADLQTIADAHFSKYELSARHIIKEIDISSFFKFFKMFGIGRTQNSNLVQKYESDDDTPANEDDYQAQSDGKEWLSLTFLQNITFF